MFMGKKEVTKEEFEKNNILTKKMYFLIEEYRERVYLSAAAVCRDIGISYRTYMGLNSGERYTVALTLRKIKTFSEKHGLSL
jgi:hypothetical protein